MKFDVYINTSVSVYDVEAKTEKEAQIKALNLMLKQITKKCAQAQQIMQK